MFSNAMLVSIKVMPTLSLCRKKELNFVKQSLSQKESLTKAAKYYHSALAEAEEYLAGRGITMEQATRARLGVVLEPLTGHEAYLNRLAIPYITRSGVVDIRFRSMDLSEPKYMGMAGATTHLYNVGAFFRATSYISICEGEIDTITLDTVCGIPAVGVPGVNNWKKHYTRLLQDFDKVFLFADGDSAGADFAKSLSRELGNLVVVSMPEGEDVNSMYRLNGVDYFQQKIESVLDVVA
jgi:DNA primase